MMASMVVSCPRCTPPDGVDQRDDGRSPGSRVLGTHRACTMETHRLWPCLPELLRSSGPPRRRGGWASGSPLTVAGAAADLPPDLSPARVHGVPFSPARAGPTIEQLCPRRCPATRSAASLSPASQLASARPATCERSVRVLTMVRRDQGRQRAARRGGSVHRRVCAPRHRRMADQPRSLKLASDASRSPLIRPSTCCATCARWRAARRLSTSGRL